MSDPGDVNQSNDKGFSNLSYVILESLKTLNASVATLQKSLTGIEVSLVSRSDLKELRDEFEGRFSKATEKRDAEIADLRDKLTALQIKTAGISALVGAAASFAIHLFKQ